MIVKYIVSRDIIGPTQTYNATYLSILPNGFNDYCYSLAQYIFKCFLFQLKHMHRFMETSYIDRLNLQATEGIQYMHIDVWLELFDSIENYISFSGIETMFDN